MIISEMQHKLATWAEADPNRRFDRLLRLIADREWLAEAARIVLASSGARTPGIDVMDKRRMQAGLDHHLADLRTNLLKGTYRPKPAKRIHIPKANGKLRPLGIPTLTDRIVQRAMLMSMEPIWESDFDRCSYGFRSERSVHHAVRTVKLQLQGGTDTTRGRWIIEGDLASYFDTVHHRLLLQCVRRRVEMRMPASFSVDVKAKLVNCDPWSVLKMSGLPCRTIASSSAATQKSAADLCCKLLRIQPYAERVLDSQSMSLCRAVPAPLFVKGRGACQRPILCLLGTRRNRKAPSPTPCKAQRVHDCQQMKTANS